MVNTHRRLRLATAAAVLLTALLVGSAGPVAAAPAAPSPTVVAATGLPAPFAGWHVSVEHSTTDPHIEWVTFDSRVLHRRATMRVVLPDAYAGSVQPLPVVYYLHGTTRIGTDPLVDQLFDGLGKAGYHSGYPFEEGSAHDEAHYLATEAAKLHFVVVSPDAGTTTWCEHCAWVDGKGGQGVNAEQHLYREVLPLTQAMFHVRTDRAGRGIMGASMGAGGTLTQALRHPDLFSVAAALSPPVDYVYDEPYGPFLWTLYLREQGYPLPAVDPTPTRAMNPADLFSNLRGEGIDTIVTVGDGCVVSAGAPQCASPVGFTDEPIDGFQELLIRRNDDAWIPSAIRSGVPMSYITYPGVHFVVNHDVFDHYLLDRMNRDFAANAPVPAAVTFRSADAQFGLWGWQVTLHRAHQQFVTVDARPDGTAFGIVGTGTLGLVSPARFVPGSTHRVEVAPGDSTRPTTTTSVVADAQGRLHLSAALGWPAGQTRITVTT